MTEQAESINPNRTILVIENKGYANLISNISKKEFLNLNNKHNFLIKAIAKDNKGQLIKSSINNSVCFFHDPESALKSAYMLDVLTNKLNKSIEKKKNQFNLRMVLNTGEFIIKNEFITGRAMLETEKMKKKECFSINTIGLSQHVFEKINSDKFICEKVDILENSKKDQSSIELFILKKEQVKNIDFNVQLLQLSDQIIESIKNPKHAKKTVIKPNAAKTNSPVIANNSNISRTKILIVDDAKIMRILLRQIIEKSGIAKGPYIEEAYDCDDGYRKYLNFKPDIITLDIEMPSSGAFYNGISVLKKIMSENKDAKIIMISASAGKVKVRDSIMSGAKDFIIKPFNEERVIQTLKKVLNI
jgi:two-component system chemotaxis response regulator CheY